MAENWGRTNAGKGEQVDLTGPDEEGDPGSPALGGGRSKNQIGLERRSLATLYSGQGTNAEVVGAAPVVDSKVIITAQRDRSRVDGIPVWGIDPETFPTVSDLPGHLQYADPPGEILLGHLEELDKQGIILGEHLARRLQVGPGFDVLLLTLRNIDVDSAVMDGFTPRVWQFLVTDHFDQPTVRSATGKKAALMSSARSRPVRKSNSTPPL